jgi:hypothetical protein
MNLNEWACAAGGFDAHIRNPVRQLNPADIA